MKSALQKDIISTKKYIKDIKICIEEAHEYISKKKDEFIFHGMHIL